MWLGVEELRPEHLRAYGELSPAASERLEISADGVAALVPMLGDRVERGQIGRQQGRERR
jgi:hypothetical protein